MSEIIPGSTLNKLKASAELLRDMQFHPFDQEPTNFTNPLKIPVTLVVKPAETTAIFENLVEGNVFEFTATDKQNPSSRCVVTMGFAMGDADLLLRYTYSEFPVDSSVVINAIEDGVKAWHGLMN